MEKEIYRVQPIIIYPECILENGYQSDCRTCEKKNTCLSPRSMCIRSYKNHKDGCPNYGKLPTCPPNIPCMYDEMFYTEEVYAVVTKFDLEAYRNERMIRRPDLPPGQLTNIRNWQPIDLKNNDIAVAEFFRENDKEDFISTRLLECMGVDVVSTMNKVGLEIKFEPLEIKKEVIRVSFIAKVLKGSLNKYGFYIYEETKNKDKKGLKVLKKVIK